MRVERLRDKHAKEVAEALEHNDGYCPCAIQKTPDTKCMCLEFRENMINPQWYGTCHCGLFEKVRE